MVEACFKFALVSKLSPEWNRFDGDLVHGVQFLTDIKRKKLRRIGKRKWSFYCVHRFRGGPREAGPVKVATESVLN